MMRNQRIFIVFAICGLIGLGLIPAESAGETRKSQVNEEMLRKMSDEEQNRQLDELARAITNLERQMNRLDGRFEKLDHDLKELKRKI